MMNKKNGGNLIMKKKNEKILVSAIAGMTALQGVSATMMNVCADEVHVSYAKVETSKKDDLEAKLHDTKKEVEDKSLALDSAAGQVAVANKQVEIIESKQEEVNQTVQQNYQAAYDAIMKELQPLMDEINSLETQIQEAKTDLDAKISASQKASEELDQAQKDLSSKKEELTQLQDKLASFEDSVDLKANLENAKTEKEAAEAELATAKENAEQADNELQAASADVETKQAAVNEVTNAYDAAVKDVTTKESIVQEKQTIVDQYNDENGMENAKAELEAAQADLAVAQTNVETMQSALAQAQSEYDTAVMASQSAQTNCDNASSELETAKNNLETAQASLEKAQADYDANQKEIEAKKNEINSLNIQISSAQNEVNKAQSDYDKALNDYNATTSPLDQAKKKLSDFETQYATDLARLNEGSKGYYESLGCYEDIKGIFDVNNDSSYRAEVASYTHMGEAGDATSLDNMQASIAYLKEYDHLRKINGLNTPKVSMTAMAIAQVNANYAQVEGNHSGAYGYSENLAWGYGEASTAGSPFRGWYDYEKKQFESGNHKFSEVGHYLNIMNDEDETTGFALQKVNGVYAQEFGYQEDKDVVMTIDEFEQSFNTYYNNLKSVDAQHKALQDAVKNASGSTTKDDSSLKSALALLNSKKDKLTGLQNQLSTLNTSKADLEKVSASKKDVIAQEEAKVSNAQNTVTQKTTVKENADKTLKNTLSVVKEKESAKVLAESKLNEAKDSLTSIQTKVDTLTDDIENWDTNKEKAMKALNQANTDLATAKENVTKASATLESLNAELDVLKAAQNEAQAKADKENTVLANVQATFDEKNSLFEAAQKKVLDYEATIQGIETAKKDVETLGTRIHELTVLKEKSEQDISNLKAEVSKLNTSLTENKANALPYEQMKNVLNSVMSNGTKADLSGVQDESMRTLLAQLSSDVDELQEINVELSTAKDSYAKKYNVYLDAKQDLMDAEKAYNTAMQSLNDYLVEPTVVKTSDTTVTSNDSVNTGVETKAFVPMMASMLAALGLFGVVNKKRKEED